MSDERPQGVRIVHADGTETLCELADAGVDDRGMHMWTLLTPLGPHDSVSADMIPPKSGLIIPVQ